jgi:hypothetical protein
MISFQRQRGRNLCRFYTKKDGFCMIDGRPRVYNKEVFEVKLDTTGPVFSETLQNVTKTHQNLADAY